MEMNPHPDGYPTIGLAPKSMPMRYRYDANLHRLSTRIERWEREQGNGNFWVTGLEHVPAPLAFELANVLVALREWHPAIRPDHVAFNSRLGENILAEAGSYATWYPRLRTAAAEGLDVASLDLGNLDGEEFGEFDADLLAELELLAGEAYGVDVESSGNIYMSRFICSLGGQKAMVRFWRMRNEVRARNKRPQRLPEIVTTPAAFTLTHEFGHLVDAELLAGGWEGAEPVYRALSEIILEVDNPSPTQWRNHLINYPTLFEHPGPAAGGKARGKATVKALTPAVAGTVGSYGATSRDELFAEAFALAYCGPVPLRRKLRPFLVALEAAGLRRGRRR